jgi:hypothetical protein
MFQGYSLNASYCVILKWWILLTMPNENHRDKLHKHTDWFVGHLTMLYEQNKLLSVE